MKAFKAFGSKGSFVADTAKEAALGFFEKFPSSRKCDIREGEYEDGFFTIAISRTDNSIKLNDITKKMVVDL
jgi:hypothetical protein